MSNPFRVPRLDGPPGKLAMAKLWDRFTEMPSSTSSTSLTIGMGPVTLTVDPDKQYAIGQTVRISAVSDPVGTWMQGVVLGYDPVTGALDVDVDAVSGSGTHDEWAAALVGATGPIGPQGPIGNPGADGEDGAAATIAVGTVTTGAPGSSASVTNTGTPSAAVFDITIPRGDKGDEGDQGPQGVPGTNGTNGADGDDGADGANGWAPVLATVADGARYVHRVVDWVGGTGAKPASGSYVGAAGLVPNIADGVDIRGAAGAGTGDVSGPAGATDGHVVLFNGTSGKALKSGGALGTAAALNAGTANGVATLDAAGKVPSAQMPPIAITSTFTVSTQAAQLALVAQEGDVAVRTDQSRSYIKNAGTAGTMADWSELLTPGAPVQSVNGKTGAVSLTAADVGAATAAQGAKADAAVLTTAKASQVQAQAGTDNDAWMTPLRTAQAVVAGNAGVPSTATRTAAFSLAQADAGHDIPVDSATGVTATVQDATTVPISGPFITFITQLGDGVVTVAEVAGVTIEPAGKRKTSGRGTSVGLRWISANRWQIVGAKS